MTAIEVKYNVVNGTDVTQLNLTIPYGSNAQKVMEMGADADAQLRFQVTYYNQELGYFVDTIGNTSSVPSENKYWILYVGLGTNLAPSPVGISHYIVPQNSTVELRYEQVSKDHHLHGFQQCKNRK